MSAEDIKRLKRIITKSIISPRSVNEIKKTFIEAGFIDSKGRVKYPYKEIFIDR